VGDRPRAEFLLGFGAVFVNRLRTRADCSVRPGDYLRLHPEPKRFLVDEIAWKDLVVAEEEDFVIVNKPSGIPTHATLDNAEENLAVQMSRALGYPLWVTHRLDAAAEGVVCLGKTKKFQAWFNKMLRKRKVRKTYRALVDKVLPLGVHHAYQEPSPRAPKRMSSTEVEGWYPCSLEILESNGESVEINLLTGRTHQIRAQLALLGAPILNDVLYGGTKLESWPDSRIGLQARHLGFFEKNFAIAPMDLPRRPV